MINWILGAAIVGFTIYVVIRKIALMRKGENACGSCSCDSKSCCSKK
ncbi:MAG: hypothetical protein K0Q65_1949 [Clostridia bacterium]|nr:hypothetical protein [Clostridia bacterium]